MCIVRRKWRCIMRTNIVLDDELVKEAMALSGAKTKKELVTNALKEFVRTRKRRNLLELDGKIDFTENYDHKRLREGI
jgi:Arc/MetJ family transcription regulator